MSNYTLLGDRIVIEPVPYEDLPVSSSGLLTPHFDKFETSNGQLRSKIARPKFTAIGKVIRISSYAQTLLEKESSTLQEGDMVLVTANALSPQFEFYEKRDPSSIAEPATMICIPHSLIEAKLTNNG